MKRLSFRHQRTIARPVEVHGIGMVTGADVRLRFAPAPPSQGVVFVRNDLPGPVHISAHVDSVTGTQRRTTLGTPPAYVSLVEHVLAALAGLRLDNCFVELNAPEPPGLDGSAWSFVEALISAGVVLQSEQRAVYGVESSVVVAHGGATIAVHPAERDELIISYFLDYGVGSPIDWQMHTEVITPENFAKNIARCRTFILESEVAELRRQGLGARTTTADLLVFGKHGPIENRLHYANEPARHKILDIMGDLSLFAADLRGHVVAYRSGHPLNVELARLLRQLQRDRCTVSHHAA